MSVNTASLAQETARYMRLSEEIMHLARTGRGHSKRLSFLQIILRRLLTSAWQIEWTV